VLLEGIVANPDQRLSELPLLTASERHQVLAAWNDTAAPRPDALLPQLIADQAARSPNTPAVMFEDSSLTFRELDTRANQLAHHLRSLGVGPDVRVGLFVERSVEAFVGLLGILKAGGAYVPLDTTYPRERLGFMLQDSGATVLVTQAWLVDRLPVATPAVVCLDAAQPQLQRLPTTPPLSGVTAAHLAYVIYTSGSTGRPKGVMIAHGAVVNLLAALDTAVYAGAPSPLRVSVNAPLSFDASVKQLIQLAHGHTLCLISEEARGDVRRMLEQIRHYQLDVLDCSPSHLRLLLEEGLGSGDEARPGRVLIGGEAIGEATWQQLAHHPRIRFFNVYGPTECTVDSTACAAHTRPAGPTIGGALANVQVYVLDAHLQPVPVGIPGELFIGGAQLARGYLGRPELTAEKFVPHPFSTTPGERLYRTGDKVRWLADGTLEYLGRFDFQVKLRGFRIELGEIEAALEQHPAVRTAVALVREDMPGNPRLVAYLVPEAELSAQDAAGVSIPELRAHLQQRLPEYMVPAAFVTLPALPLTTNGKLDRKALPVPDLTAGGASSVTPRTPTEELLAGIWCQLLGLPQVGVTDSFFELGGHSLLATQAISRIRSAFQVDLPLRALFEAPTVAALAPRVEAAMRAGQGLQAPPLVPVARDAGPLPLSFPQQRLWFLDQLTPGSALYNIPMALRLEGTLDVAALEYAFEELIRRHESLRTSFQLTGGQVVQVFAPAQAWPLGVVDLRQLPEGSQESEVRRLAGEEAMRPFDLARGPLFRATLLRLGEQDHVLLVTVHHIVSDGWSSGVLVRELAALYSARATGTQPALPALPVQYADYAAWQRGWLQGDVLQRQLDYWRNHLAGAPQALELPTDRPRPAVQSHRGAAHSTRLSRQLSDALQALGQREGATPFMLLLAAFQLLLSRYSGQDDIVVGSPIAGRTQAQTEGLIGFFVNTLVLRTRLDAHATFRQLLGQVRETALGAYAHQDVPFEKLVEELHPERSLSRTPLFQVMLTVQNTPRQELSLPGLKLRGVEAGSEVAKFDLTLSLSDTPDGLAATLVYNADLFEAATAGRMLEHLRVLLEGIVANPDQRLSELPLLTASERHQVLTAWNDTAVAYRPDLFVHEQVAARAQGAHQALAIRSASGELTYGELERRANQLAHHLRSLGVGPEVCVGVLMERSVDLAVGLLAILKAGGAYLPLDTAYPRERLRFMLQDSAARVLLTRSALLERFDLGSATASVVCLDTQHGVLDVQPTTAPAPALTPDTLAYVIYTSGSSGRPKGVQVSHGSLANLVAWHQRTYAVTSGDRATQLAGTAFDASVWELWPYLAAGASLHLPPEDVRTVPEALVRWLCAEAITLSFLPTPLAESALEMNWPERPALRALLTGGDRLRSRPRPDLGFRLVNHYGPTESTVVTTCADVAAHAPAGTLPSIGRPIDNTQVYLLDRHLRLVPPGAAGELVHRRRRPGARLPGPARPHRRAASCRTPSAP
ncbi:amino acid adenylation domain-containing protein, partial [Pyxidicoccus sp. 3LFB2]